MSTSIRSVPPDLDTAAARHLMRSAGVRHLLVMRDDRILGIVSHRDLGGTRDESLPAGAVEHVMKSHVVVAAPEMKVQEAAALLRGYNIGCLPVVDGKKLVGIVTTSDLLALVAQHTRPGHDRHERHAKR